MTDQKLPNIWPQTTGAPILITSTTQGLQLWHHYCHWKGRCSSAKREDSNPAGFRKVQQSCCEITLKNHCILWFVCMVLWFEVLEITVFFSISKFMFTNVCSGQGNGTFSFVSDGWRIVIIGMLQQKNRFTPQQTNHRYCYLWNFRVLRGFACVQGSWYMKPTQRMN